MVKLNKGKWPLINLVAKYSISFLFNELRKSEPVWLFESGKALNYNSFKIKTGTRIQVSTRYFGESLTAQGSRDAYWMANLGVRQDLLKRKLILTLTIKDIFSTMTNIATVESPNQYILTRQYLRGPIFGISLSYAINSFKQKVPETMNLDVGGGGF